MRQISQVSRVYQDPKDSSCCPIVAFPLPATYFPLNESLAGIQPWIKKDLGESMFKVEQDTLFVKNLKITHCTCYYLKYTARIGNFIRNSHEL